MIITRETKVFKSDWRLAVCSGGSEREPWRLGGDLGRGNWEKELGRWAGIRSPRASDTVVASLESVLESVLRVTGGHKGFQATERPFVWKTLLDQVWGMDGKVGQADCGRWNQAGNSQMRARAARKAMLAVGAEKIKRSIRDGEGPTGCGGRGPQAPPRALSCSFASQAPWGQAWIFGAQNEWKHQQQSPRGLAMVTTSADIGPG